MWMKPVKYSPEFISLRYNYWPFYCQRYFCPNTVAGDSNSQYLYKCNLVTKRSKSSVIQILLRMEILGTDSNITIVQVRVSPLDPIIARLFITIVHTSEFNY